MFYPIAMTGQLEIWFMLPAMLMRRKKKSRFGLKTKNWLITVYFKKRCYMMSILTELRNNLKDLVINKVF
jgi:hypothetical protein